MLHTAVGISISCNRALRSSADQLILKNNCFIIVGGFLKHLVQPPSTIG